jgi:hypothetical protein
MFLKDVYVQNVNLFLKISMFKTKRMVAAAILPIHLSLSGGEEKSLMSFFHRLLWFRLAF